MQGMNGSLISLIPGGCPQFLDIRLDVAPLARRKLFFREQAQAVPPGADGTIPYDLFCLEWDDESQDHLDRATGKPGRYDYEVGAHSALATFLDQWIPIPYLRVRPDRWADGGPRFEKGPSNWARVRVARDPSHDGEDLRFVAVVMFDTACEHPLEDDPTYFALSHQNVEENAQFGLAHHERDNAWMLNCAWVDEWLRGVFDRWLAESRKGKKSWADDDKQRCLEHLARYLTFLDLLQRSADMPVVRVVDPAQYTPIDVDLVLDIGNSRTCGILVETRPQATTNLNDSYVLQVRDLSRPEIIYTDPFETRVEFVEAQFGNARLSSRSGRETEAFVWPSIVRVGPEAVRLGSESWGGEGNTGMSSPKRYLWDERARVQQWRLNGIQPDGTREPPVTRGVFVQFINKEGSLLDRLDDRSSRNNPVLKKQSRDVAFESRFTRSSVMMFLLSEILAHALVTINSPAQRATREHADIPRRLRRIMLTVPTAMPLAEQKIFRRWANWAVDLVWRSLGWQDWYVDRAKRGGRLERADYRINPEVRCNWDEATASQMVLIYNELSEKYQGDVHYLFRLFGKKRPNMGGNPSLRVASIDIGGGTTDLSITTYEALGDESATTRIHPHVTFRDGFNIAGDDVLGAVVEDHVLKELRDGLGRAGIPDARGVLARLFGRDMLGQSQMERNHRGQFARHVATPIALALLGVYESADPSRPPPPQKRSIRDLLAGSPLPSDQILAYAEQPIRDAGLRDFSLLDAEITVNVAAIERTVATELGRLLTDFCEIVHLYDCDLLMLTGRPCRWPAVLSTVLAKLPVPPDRIISMNEFRVGRWYPFADHLGRIRDPKTTVVVGSILGALAEGHLEGFALDVAAVPFTSTARFIGEMDLESGLKRAKVWFEVDVDNPNGAELSRDVAFSGPLPIGFRQLDAERWTTTRFHIIDFATAEARSNAKGRLPYTVKLAYRMPSQDEAEDTHADRDEGELTIEEIVMRDGEPVHPGELEIRLQTLPSEEGFWLDSGIFNIV